MSDVVGVDPIFATIGDRRKTRRSADARERESHSGTDAIIC